jgi:bacteriocin biosynthesis cyclodehydratase domain-containing protein
MSSSARSTAPPAAKPALKPALRQIWRDDATLQLGLVPDHAVVLSGLAPDDAKLIELLDGTREMSSVVQAAADLGVAPDRCAELINLLHAADVLDVDPPVVDTPLSPDRLSLSLLHPGAGAAARVLARRNAATVRVQGAGRIGAAIAGLLKASGVGTVIVVDAGPARPSDTHPAGLRAPKSGTRASAVAATFGVVARVDADDARNVDVDVVAPVGAVPRPEVLASARRHPHLLVTVRETTALVGPFVRPGVTACLRCLELSRRDRDPAWPALTAQLVGSASAVEPCDLTLASLAASLACMQVLTHLDGAQRPQSEGGVLEFGLRDGRLRRRSISSHPACGCGAADATETMDM